MSTYQFRHDRAGYTGPLRVHIESTAAYGAAGLAGLGQGQGFADGIINLAGLLKAADGGDYNAAGTAPGEGFIPPEHRLTVYRGATAISSLSFVPVETAPGIVDINTLLSQGRAVAATPEQLLSLAAVAAELEAQNGTFGQTLTAIQAALADTEQYAGGVTIRDNLAAITGADGYYKAADTGYVYQRTGGVNTRRPNMEGASGTRVAAVEAAATATEKITRGIVTPWVYGASGGRSADDRGAVQNAIDGTPEGGILDLSTSLGFKVSEALYVSRPITIVFNSAGSILEQTTFGKPHFYIDGAPDVIFRGVAQLAYLGARPSIKNAPNPTSADTRLNPLYQVGAGNSRNLAAGVYLHNKCDRFTADHIYVKGQVTGVSHNTLGGDDIYYSDDNEIGVLHVDTVDFGYLSGGFRRFKIGTVKARGITTSQGDPSHAVYVGPRTIPNTSLEIGSIDLDGAATVADADDLLGASDAFSIRATDLVTLGSVRTRNTQYVGNFQSGRIQLGSINAVLLPLLSGTTVEGLATPIQVQDNADVTIGEARIESALGWSTGRQDAFVYSVSGGAKLRVRQSYTKMTAASPARVARLSGSGALMEFSNPEVEYVNDFAVGYSNPAAFTSISTTGRFNIINPRLTGTDKLFVAASAGIKWDMTLDPSLIANNTSSTVLDLSGQYHVKFGVTPETPVTLAAWTGDLGQQTRSRNHLKIANTAAAYLAALNGTTPGQQYTLTCTDSVTAIRNNASIITGTGADIAPGWKTLVLLAGAGGVCTVISRGTTSTTPSGTATLDFPSIAAGTATSLTATVTGVVAGDTLAWDAPTLPDGIAVQQVKVTAPNTVTVRLYNPTAAAIDPPSGVWTFRAAR